MATEAHAQPVILGIGGTLRGTSTSETALRIALAGAQSRGAITEVLTARDLDLPMYDPGDSSRVDARAHRLLDAVRRADGVIIATPGYHGGMSGLLKNALDFLEEIADEPVPYLHGRAVGCIVSAAGPQAGAAALGSLRSTVHALRGWPTPIGVVINSLTKPFTPDATDTKIASQLDILADQVVSFAMHRPREKVVA